MARDAGLESLITEDLGTSAGLTQKPMFGGIAWLLHGNLLCGARQGSLMLRLGRENDDWAIEIPGVTRVVMQGRSMPGWVRAEPAVYGEDALRRRLLEAAVRFVSTLPKK